MKHPKPQHDQPLGPEGDFITIILCIMALLPAIAFSGCTRPVKPRTDRQTERIIAETDATIQRMEAKLNEINSRPALDSAIVQDWEEMSKARLAARHWAYQMERKKDRERLSVKQ